MGAILTTRGAADYLQVSLTTIYRWLAGNRLPAWRMVGNWRFFKQELELWVMGAIVVCHSCGQIYRRIDTELDQDERHRLEEQALKDNLGLLYMDAGEAITCELKCGNCEKGIGGD